MSRTHPHKTDPNSAAVDFDIIGFPRDQDNQDILMPEEEFCRINQRSKGSEMFSANLFPHSFGWSMPALTNISTRTIGLKNGSYLLSSFGTFGSRSEYSSARASS
mmetsp:Transcript_10431/g.25605  ORF Transcript_10431/g.25605 Transcript_10431/m.25605 type:complete len:105 (+) Transcript_10431:357-671(+)